MTNQVTMTTMKRVIVLLAAMVVALSTLAAAASDAKAATLQCTSTGPCNGTSANDHYVFPSTSFGTITLDDPGGSLDIVNLRSYNRADFDIHRGSGSEGDSVFVVGKGSQQRNVIIKDFYASDSGPSFGSGKIEYFWFKDGLVKAEKLGI